METEGPGEESAGADATAGEEAAGAAAAEAGEGSGDRTDRRILCRCRGAGLRGAPARRLLEGRRRYLHQATLGVELQGAGRGGDL